MTMLKVLKPFTTRLQRFKAGDEIAEGTDLSPHTVDSLTKGGVLPEPPKPAKSKPAA